MKNIHYTNILFYVTIIGLYLFQPVLGALSQIGLGAFQFVIAVKLIDDVQTNNKIGHNALKIYWCLVFVWFSIFMVYLFTDILNQHLVSILYIIPMFIGLYFIITTYLIRKNQKS